VLVETVISWAVVGGIILFFLLPHIIKTRRNAKLAKEAQEKSAETLNERPHIKRPQIDTGLCIGCGTCVKKCPESGVLAVIGGKSNLVNIDGCVGHGICESSCPVGAITLGTGESDQALEIPLLDKTFQSSIPGIYIIGELRGLPLIRNAVNQATTAVRSIKPRPRNTHDNSTYDVIIVGAGPAGLTAALAATEKGLRYLLIDEHGVGGTIRLYPENKLTLTTPVVLPLFGKLSQHEYKKEDLVALWETLHERYSLKTLLLHRLDNILQKDHVFTVEVAPIKDLEKNQIFHAQNIVLALGRRGSPIRLEIPGEDLSKVVYTISDARTYAQQNVLVVGGNDTAIETAVELAQQEGTTVTLSHKEDSFTSIRKRSSVLLNKMVKTGRINVLYNSTVTEIRDKDVCLKLTEETTLIPNDFVFICLGRNSPVDWIRKLGIKFGAET
jgi:thioredoxin reductase